MKNIFERQKDILSIISSLDISPTMFKNAVEKYTTITKFLESRGIDADMYPQGSFSFGTVVRPKTKGKSENYDLDFICQVHGNRDDYAPGELRKTIEDILCSSEIYGGKLQVYDECFTVEYADVDGVGFNIDIVPAVDEIQNNKNRLIEKSSEPELIGTSIAIPKKNGDKNYTWLTNNPKGLRSWFEKRNKPFLNANTKEYRKHLFEANQAIFASIEEIPHELDRSALQRVIQILKYHRNVYFSNIKNGDEIKPISAIINVGTTQIASSYNPECSVFELLEYVIRELNIYSKQQYLTSNEFTKTYGARTVFSETEGKWFIANPANPEDNLADKWNENEEIPKYFFRWIKAVKNDLLESLQLENDQQFRTSIENGLGGSVVSSVLGKKYCNNITPEPILSKNAAKPYLVL